MSGLGSRGGGRENIDDRIQLLASFGELAEGNEFEGLLKGFFPGINVGQLRCIHHLYEILVSLETNHRGGFRNDLFKNPSERPHRHMIGKQARETNHADHRHCRHQLNQCPHPHRSVLLTANPAA